MSPEQMQSARDVDARADIWSLGAIVFEMLAKRPPYQANTLPELCQAISNSDPPKLRKFRPDVPEGLEQAIGLCLKRDLAQRWSNVMDLAQALAPFAPRRRGQRELSKNSSNALLGTGDAGASSPGHAAPNLGTLSSWQTSQHKKRQRKQAVRAVVVLVVVLGALSLLVLLPKHGPGPAKPHVSSLPAPAAPGPARAASRGAPPAVQQAEPQRADTSVEQRQVAVVAPVPPESDASGHPTPSVVPVGRGSRPPAHDTKPVVQPPVKAIAPTAAGPESKQPKPPEELSDFGGRR
jgi:serine/threonine-protein kinase